MTDSIINFEWQVPDDGFEWVRAQATGNRISRGGYVLPSGFRSNEGRPDPENDYIFLLPKNARWEGMDITIPYLGPAAALGISKSFSYRPLEKNSALFREFVDLPGSFSDIREFADKWGSLGSDVSWQIVLPKYESARWGEPPGRWSDEFVEMRMAVEIWDIARRNDQNALKNLIVFEDDCVLLRYKTGDRSPQENVGNYLDIESRDELEQLMEQVVQGMEQHVCVTTGNIFAELFLSEKYHHPERMSVISKDDLPTAALFAVEDLINEGLKGRVSAQMGWSNDEGRQVTQLVPDSLIGAMWLQFSMAVSRDIDFEHCLECQSWFEIAPGSGRPDKSYCSDACRMRAYRKRKKAKNNG